MDNVDEQQQQMPVMYPLPPDAETMKMICDSLLDDSQKWRISVLSGLVFLLISSPLLYRLTGSLGECLGLSISSVSGCPTTLGLLLHTVVFVLVTKLLMN